MAIKKTQQEAVKKYNAKNYDEIKLRVEAGNKDVIFEYAEQQNKTMNTLLNEILAQSIPGFSYTMGKGDPKNRGSHVTREQIDERLKKEEEERKRLKQAKEQTNPDQK